jgi:hypothetical protein
LSPYTRTQRLPPVRHVCQISVKSLPPQTCGAESKIHRAVTVGVVGYQRQPFEVQAPDGLAKPELLAGVAHAMLIQRMGSRFGVTFSAALR